MAFDIVGFLIGQTLAEREGISRARATQLALVPAFLDMSLPVSLVMTQAIARREAPVKAAAVPQEIQVPLSSIEGRHYVYARGFLEGRGFVNVTPTKGDHTFETPKFNKVYKVDPPLVSDLSTEVCVYYYVSEQAGTAEEGATSSSEETGESGGEGSQGNPSGGRARGRSG